MRINSEESIQAAAEVHKQYGSWSAAIEDAVYVDGVYCLPSSAPAKQHTAATQSEPTVSRD